MPLKHDSEGFLQGTPIAVERGSFDKAIAVWQSIKGDTKAIREAMGVAKPGSRSAFTDNQVRLVADRIGKAVQTVASTRQQVPVNERVKRTRRTAKPGDAPSETVPSSSASPVPPQNRNVPNNMKERAVGERDSKGRFVGGNGRGDGGGGGGSYGDSERIASAIKDGFSHAGDNLEDLDPVIKASKETKELAGNVIGFAKGTANVFKGIWTVGKRGFGIGRAMAAILTGKGDKQLLLLKRILKELKRGNDRSPASGGSGESGWLRLFIPMIGGALATMAPILMGMVAASAPFVLPAITGVIGAVFGDYIYKKFGPQILNAIEGTVNFFKESFAKAVDVASRGIEAVDNLRKGAIDKTSRGMEAVFNAPGAAVNWAKGALGMRKKVEFSGFAGAESLSQYGTYTSAEAEHIANLKRSGANTSANIGGMPKAIQDKIIASAKAAGVDPSMMLSIAAMESGGNVNAISSTGASGVFQLTGKTASNLGVKNRFDADQNIAGGMKLAQENIAALNRAGIPVTTQSLYMMHQLGQTAAIEVLRGAQSGKSVSQLSATTRQAMGMNVGSGSASVSEYIARNMAAMKKTSIAAGVSGVMAAPSYSASVSQASIPDAPAVRIPLSASGNGQTIVKVDAPVTQNVADRGIANVATGGMGGR